MHAPSTLVHDSTFSSVSEFSTSDVIQGNEDDDIQITVSSIAHEELSKQLFSAEHIWFTNMLLLGFNLQAEQKKFNIVFSEDMFRRPNEKGMEAVLYFLFYRLLGPKVCKETFRLVWPVHDKVQARDFKKLVFTLLQQLEKEDNLPPNTVRQSHIQTCSGERFYNLLRHFSTHVIKVVLKRDLGASNISSTNNNSNNSNSNSANTNNSSPPSYFVPYSFTTLDHGYMKQTQNQLSTVKLAPQLSRATKVQAVMECQKFVNSSAHIVATKNEWQQYQRELQAEAQQLRRELDDLRRQDRELSATFPASVGGDSEERVLESNIALLRSFWKSVEHHHYENDYYREMINGIVNKQANPYRLDLNDLIFNLPQLEIPELQRKLDTVELYRNDKLDLSALVHVWNLCATAVHARLSDFNTNNNNSNSSNSNNSTSTPEGNFSELSPLLEEYVRTHQDHVTNLRALNAALATELQQLQQQQQQLADASVMSPSVSRSQQRDESFQLVPPTPPSFMSALGGNNNNNNNNYVDEDGDMETLSPHAGNSTPGVLAKLAQSVRRVATAGPRSLQAANTMLLPQYQQQQHLHAYYFDDAEDVDDDHNIHASLLSVSRGAGAHSNNNNNNAAQLTVRKKLLFESAARPNTVSKVGGLAHSNFDNNTSQIDDNKFKKPSTVVTKSKQSQQQHNKSTRSNNNNNNGGNFDKYIGGGQTPTHSHLSASLGSTSTKKHTTNPSSLSTSTNTQPQRSHKGLSSSLVSTTGAPSSSTRSGPEPRATTNPSLSSSLPLASNSNKTVAESSKKIQYKPKQNALSKLADQLVDHVLDAEENSNNKSTIKAKNRSTATAATTSKVEEEYYHSIVDTMQAMDEGIAFSTRKQIPRTPLHPTPARSAVTSPSSPSVARSPLFTRLSPQLSPPNNHANNNNNTNDYHNDVNFDEDNDMVRGAPMQASELLPTALDLETQQQREEEEQGGEEQEEQQAEEREEEGQGEFEEQQDVAEEEEQQQEEEEGQPEQEYEYDDYEQERGEENEMQYEEEEQAQEGEVAQVDSVMDGYDSEHNQYYRDNNNDNDDHNNGDHEAETYDYDYNNNDNNDNHNENEYVDGDGNFQDEVQEEHGEDEVEDDESDRVNVDNHADNVHYYEHDNYYNNSNNNDGDHDNTDANNNNEGGVDEIDEDFEEQPQQEQDNSFRDFGNADFILQALENEDNEDDDEVIINPKNRNKDAATQNSNQPTQGNAADRILQEVNDVVATLQLDDWDISGGIGGGGRSSIAGGATRVVGSGVDGVVDEEGDTFITQLSPVKTPKHPHFSPSPVRTPPSPGFQLLSPGELTYDDLLFSTSPLDRRHSSGIGAGSRQQ